MKKNIVKRNIKKSRAVTAVIMTTAMLLLGGCGSNTNDKKSGEKSDSGSENVKTVVIGSGISYVPYAYLDDDGNAVGYDYDVLKAIDDYLTDYEFTYDSMSFDNILLSLDADKIDVAAHEYEYTDERAEKYLFSDEYYSEFITRIAVSVDNDEIKSIDDLAGKKVNAGGSTSATYTILTAWNEEHPGQEIELISTESVNNETTATNIKNGVWDAAIIEQKDIIKMNENFGDGEDFLKLVGDPINESHGYYLFNKDDTELKAAFDKAIIALKDDGTIDAIADKWLSSDTQ
ncbi:MAG: transporter substrate-binding domain-containing protein [Lachnospiraceae bacterium]|nr:transporter substrate-binding domain-containing protein [Lachnospiraceae bacterium]